jgi:hypothetical protein
MGLVHGLLTKNRAVVVDVLTRRAPPWLYKLALNCSDTSAPWYVRGNIGVEYKAAATSAVKAALASVR